MATVYARRSYLIIKEGGGRLHGFSPVTMKFVSLLSAVLVFALSTANAAKEPAILEFVEAPPQEYRIHADLLMRRTSHVIVLRTEDPNWPAINPGRSFGVVDYEQFPSGECRAIISDSTVDRRDKTLRIDLFGAGGGRFNYEGRSVIDQDIDNLQVDGFVRTIA